MHERGRGQHLLEVVEHEQGRLVAEPPRDRLASGSCGRSPATPSTSAIAEPTMPGSGPAPGRRRTPGRVRGAAARRRRARAASCRCRPGRSASRGARPLCAASSTSAASSASRPISGVGAAGRFDADRRVSAWSCSRRGVGATRLSPPRQARSASITRGRCEARVLLLGQRLRDDVVERPPAARAGSVAAGRRIEQVRVHDRHVGLAIERLLARQALEEQAAERVDVRRRADRLALDLLRRGVVERADEEAGPGSGPVLRACFAIPKSVR